MLAVRAHDIELVVVARPGARDEQFPIAGAAHPHRIESSVAAIEFQHAELGTAGERDAHVGRRRWIVNDRRLAGRQRDDGTGRRIGAGIQTRDQIHNG